VFEPSAEVIRKDKAGKPLRFVTETSLTTDLKRLDFTPTGSGSSLIGSHRDKTEGSRATVAAGRRPWTSEPGFTASGCSTTKGRFATTSLTPQYCPNCPPTT